MFMSKQKGFSLVELSVVLTVIGITLAGALELATSKTESDRISETNTRISAIEQAMESFLIKNQRIPCPADATAALSSASAGVESNDGAAPPICNKNNNGSSGVWVGGLPTKTLGLPDRYMADDWGRRFIYAVKSDFTNNITTNPLCDGDSASGASHLICFKYTTAGNITVNDSTGAARTTEAVYVIVSHGKNGFGAWTYSGTGPLAASSDTDEVQNAQDGGVYNSTFVQKDSSTTFDDIVEYKTKALLIDNISGITDSTTCAAAASSSATCTGEAASDCTNMAAQVNKFCLQR